MTAALHLRVKRARERALIRSWEYRQRRHSHGVWYRLRRVLVDAAQAFAISAEQAAQLEAAGYESLPVGRELEPRKSLFIVDEQCLSTLSNRREVRVGLGSDLLSAEHLVLLPHRPR